MIVDQYGRPFDRPQQKHRVLRARYDAAETSDGDRKHWAMSDALSAVSANSAGIRQTLRNRSRYEISNNSYARGIINTLAAYTVGSGPTLQLTHRGETRSPEITNAARQVEQLWSNWAYVRDLPSKVHTMQMALDGDGEAFGMMTNSDRPNMHTPVTLDVRLYEADHFDNWSAVGFYEDDAGVKIDASGRPTEYAFVEQHPGSSYTTTTALSSKWVSAEQVIHLFRQERPEQLRGVPRTTPALPLFALLRRFALATCVAAETAADFSAILTPSEDNPDGSDQADPWDRLEIERGALLTTPGGSKLYQLKSEHPNSTFDDFVRAILREIARCLSVPAVVALGDASRYNYASGRLDLQAFLRQIEVERALLLERRCLDRLFEEWLDEALLIPGFLPPAFVEVVSEFEWGWRWQGLPHIDRKKEADGQAAELANHTTTLAREYARQGLDWETEIRHRAEEIKLLRELGLTPGEAQPARPASDVDEPEDEEEENEVASV